MRSLILRTGLSVYEMTTVTSELSPCPLTVIVVPAVLVPVGLTKMRVSNNSGR